MEKVSKKKLLPFLANSLEQLHLVFGWLISLSKVSNDKNLSVKEIKLLGSQREHIRGLSQNFLEWLMLNDLLLLH